MVAQPQPLEVLFDSIDANNSCSFTKKKLNFKQAYLVGFCFVLCNKLIFFFQLSLVVTECFSQALFGNNLILHQTQ